MREIKLKFSSSYIAPINYKLPCDLKVNIEDIDRETSLINHFLNFGMIYTNFHPT